MKKPSRAAAALQVPRPRIQVRPAGAAGGGGPEPAHHHGGRPLGREGGGRQPPPGADGGRPEEAAQSSAAAAHQRDPALLHQPGDVLHPGPRRAEVRLPGPPLLLHPGRRRDPRRAQSEKSLQLLGSLRRLEETGAKTLVNAADQTANSKLSLFSEALLNYECKDVS